MFTVCQQDAYVLGLFVWHPPSAHQKRFCFSVLRVILLFCRTPLMQPLRAAGENDTLKFPASDGIIPEGGYEVEPEGLPLTHLNLDAPALNLLSILSIHALQDGTPGVCFRYVLRCTQMHKFIRDLRVRFMLILLLGFCAAWTWAVLQAFRGYTLPPTSGSLAEKMVAAYTFETQATLFTSSRCEGRQERTTVIAYSQQVPPKRRKISLNQHCSTNAIGVNNEQLWKSKITKG